MPSEDRDEYLSPGEVARILHVSPKTVARWADAGWLSCVLTLGGHRRFARDEIEALEAKLSRAGSPPTPVRHQRRSEPGEQPT